MTATCQLSAGLLLALCLAPSVHAARPFVTDDARIVDRGGCQIETYGKRQRGYDESEFWFLPACNPWGVELTAGGYRVDSTPYGDTHTFLVQGKALLKPLETNGYGLALTLGLSNDSPGSVTKPYVNGIASFSFLDDRAVVHANLGVLRDHGTWGLGLEALLYAPRVYAIMETYGQAGDKPTQHVGLRFWIVPGRVQVDATYGYQNVQPAQRFNTVGLRILW